jgi:O-antigen/teichoic acid export membrane protein
MMSGSPTTVGDLATGISARSSHFRATFVSNVMASLLRVAAVSLVALILPAYLIHRLPVQTYAAWVLIIQMGAYVSYLDLGIQVAVSKFVAEYDARNDHLGAGLHASAGFALMAIAGTVGLGLSLFLAWRVPTLFAAMPADLFHDVRISVVLVGSSLSFGLVCAVYSAVFLGLQRYWIPTTITIINRIAFAAVVIATVALRGNLAAMGIAVAGVNVFSGLAQLFAWRRKAAHIPVSLLLVQSRILKSVAGFCSLQSIWTMAMLCVSGLDLTIVGHYDYLQTAYYSIATLPTSFTLMILSAMLNPLLPASSAMSTQRSPAQMGALLVKTTRYATLVLLLTALPLIVCGLPILRLWIGSAYALHTIGYLRMLVFANVIRNLCAPYATMIVATNRQGAAVVTALSEAIVNLGSSLYLASRYGAIGVALGTVFGSFVSVSLHFAITMHFTSQTLAISRRTLFLKGLVRPSIVVIPSTLFFPLWLRSSRIKMSAGMTMVWVISTVILGWYFGLDREERSKIVHVTKGNA